MLHEIEILPKSFILNEKFSKLLNWIFFVNRSISLLHIILYFFIKYIYKNIYLQAHIFNFINYLSNKLFYYNFNKVTNYNFFFLIYLIFVRVLKKNLTTNIFFSGLIYLNYYFIDLYFIKVFFKRNQIFTYKNSKLFKLLNLIKFLFFNKYIFFKYWKSIFYFLFSATVKKKLIYQVNYFLHLFNLKFFKSTRFYFLELKNITYLFNIYTIKKFDVIFFKRQKFLLNSWHLLCLSKFNITKLRLKIVGKKKEQIFKNFFAIIILHWFLFLQSKINYFLFGSFILQLIKFLFWWNFYCKKLKNRNYSFIKKIKTYKSKKAKLLGKIIWIYRSNSYFTAFWFGLLSILRKKYLNLFCFENLFSLNYKFQWHLQILSYFATFLIHEKNLSLYFYFFVALQIGISKKLKSFLLTTFKTLQMQSKYFFNIIRKFRGSRQFKHFLKFLKKKFLEIIKLNCFLEVISNFFKLDINLPIGKLIAQNIDFIFTKNFYLNYLRLLDIFSYVLHKLSFEFSEMQLRKLRSRFYKVLIFCKFHLIENPRVLVSNIIISLLHNLNHIILDIDFFFNQISQYLNLPWYLNLLKWSYFIKNKKRYQLRKKWLLWRIFKNWIVQFRKGQSLNFFFKNNNFLIRYYTFFYQYKLKMLKKFTVYSFITILESKLDIIVYRFGFTKSNILAKILIKQGGILVNDFKIQFPSFFVVIGSIIRLNFYFWGNFIWRLNFSKLLITKKPWQHIIFSYRLLGGVITRNLYINEFFSKKQDLSNLQIYYRWLFYLL